MSLIKKQATIIAKLEAMLEIKDDIARFENRRIDLLNAIADYELGLFSVTKEKTLTKRLTKFRGRSI